MDVKKFLSSVELFRDIGPDELAPIAEAAELVEYPAGTTVIRRGDFARFMWIVYDGEVEVTQPRADGSTAVLATMGRGEIFGEMSIITGEPAVANVVTAVSVKAVKIPREIFSGVMARTPQTLARIAKLVTMRLLQRDKDEEHTHRLSAAHMENEDPYDLNLSSSLDPRKILVLNCGSSSLKYALFDTTKGGPVFEGLIEKIGSEAAFHKMKTPGGKKERPEPGVRDMAGAFEAMIASVTDDSFGAIRDIQEISAVGHRVAHGGDRFGSSVIIDDEVVGAVRAFYPLAPLHNPYNLAGIEKMRGTLPDVPQVAVFDTSFHQTIPDNAYTYGLPHRVCETERIRRYGFHGTNHKFVALSAAGFLKRPLDELKIITCHLGNGASLCAIDHGRSVDTSMGMTPLEGLIMGTRVGDLDPGVILHMMRQLGVGVDEVDRMLNKDSGLKGISGLSNDMREILDAAEKGDIRCKRAVSTFCYRVKKYIGSYLAVLGGVDVIVFTGGIGENSAEIRARICHGLERLGIVVYGDTNREARPRRGQVADISEPGSRTRILVIPADEEKMIARETVHAMGRVTTVETVEKFHALPIPLSISAHHVHLCQKDFEALFGAGRELTPKIELSQPGQYAAAETVNLVGPKGRVERVRILGPLRKESQVEISRTEEYQLGIDAPVRNSGDIEGTPGIVMEGPKGQIKLEKGVICARRHIHISPTEALRLGLRDKDVVMVKVKGVRELIFGDVLVRVHPQYKLDMHLDTDEGNAAEISKGAAGWIESIQHRAFM